MDKGYYTNSLIASFMSRLLSQSTIKMDKGYYKAAKVAMINVTDVVAIHNKNGQGLLHQTF